MAAVSNDASLNGLADGTSISSSNNGGGGTNTLMTLTGSGGVERRPASSPNPPGDVAAYEFPAKTTSNGYFVITPGGYSALTGGAIGAWVYFASAPAPANSQQFMRWGNTSQNGLTISGAGKFTLTVNSAVVYTSTVTIAAATWYWISHSSNSSSTLGQSKFGIWSAAGASLDSFTSATTLNTSAITSAASSVGKANTLSGLPLFRITSIRANADANNLISPVMSPPVAPVAPTLRGWGIAA